MCFKDLYTHLQEHLAAYVAKSYDSQSCSKTKPFSYIFCVI